MSFLKIISILLLSCSVAKCIIKSSKVGVQGMQLKKVIYWNQRNLWWWWIFKHCFTSLAQPYTKQNHYIATPKNSNSHIPCLLRRARTHENTRFRPLSSVQISNFELNKIGLTPLNWGRRPIFNSTNTPSARTSQGYCWTSIDINLAYIPLHLMH